MATITKAAVKMYRLEELGDCFLLTFTKGTAVSNMLIDCGAFQQSKDRLRKIATSIKKELKGRKLNVVVGTHQHNDHVNGFFHAEDIFKDAVDQVWLSWLDNPRDGLAREVGTLYNNFTKKLTDIAFHLNTAPNVKGFSRTAKNLEDSLQSLGLSDKRKPTDKTPPVKPKESIAVLKKIGDNPVAYLKPGRIIDMPGLPPNTVKIYVLGPPRKEEFLFDETPSKEQTYDPKKLQMMDQLAATFLSGVSNFTPGTPATEEDHFPFNSRKKITEGKLDPGIKEIYRTAGLEWRTISEEWLNQAERMGLWMDNFTNNSSLVLAIELVQSGKFLLFAADAMAGNWASWESIPWEVTGVSLDTILSKTVLYKVGHHGSHNASLKPLCEKMTHEDLIAMIPVDKNDSNINREGGWKMPAKKLNKRLVELTKNRVLRMDDVFDKNCKPDTEPAKSSWKKSKVTPTFNDLFIQVIIKDTD